MEQLNTCTLCCCMLLIKVQWALSPTLEQLQSKVDHCNKALDLLKALANCCTTFLTQVKSTRAAMAKHLEEEEKTRKKEEERHSKQLLRQGPAMQSLNQPPSAVCPLQVMMRDSNSMCLDIGHCRYLDFVSKIPFQNGFLLTSATVLSNLARKEAQLN